jgi:uncharacterized Ntn-hydrolase superfamily protein
MVERAYGPRGLARMRDGMSAPAALQQLLGDDEQSEVRQVAMVDGGGRVAVHTGRGCIPEAGHAVREQVSAQANIMRRDTVPDAMVRAYTDAAGHALADRLLAALDAAEREGGDLRGRQSAAMVVVAGRATGEPGQDTRVDLRVEDHPDPVGELRRLVSLHGAYRRAEEGDERAARGDVEGALAEYAAAHRSQPDNAELAFWHAVALASNGREDEAAPILRSAVKRHSGWAELLERLPAAGLFPDDPELIARLLGTRTVSEPLEAPVEAPRPGVPPPPGPPSYPG